MMNVDDYIDWQKLWDEEMQISDNNPYELCDELNEVFKRFINDKNVKLMPEECSCDSNRIVILFGETGGQSEGDTQGWSRDYTFILDSDFFIKSVSYEQG